MGCPLRTIRFDVNSEHITQRGDDYFVTFAESAFLDILKNHRRFHYYVQTDPNVVIIMIARDNAIRFNTG